MREQKSSQAHSKSLRGNRFGGESMETQVYWLWLLSMASLIFLMQAGFFLLEGGQVRSRDVSNVLMKMNGHLAVGTVLFLCGGFAIKQYAWPLVHMPIGRMPWD